MNVVETGELLQAVETKYDLLRPSLAGWRAWVVLRFAVAMAMWDLPISRNTEEGRLTLRERLQLGARDLWGTLRAPRDGTLTLVNTSNWAEVVNNRAKDIYFDDLLLALKTPVVKLEHINNKQYAERRDSALLPACISTTGNYLLSGMLAKLPLSTAVKTLAAHFTPIIQNDLQQKLFSFERVANLLQTFVWRKRIFKGMLKALRPRRLLLINSYNNAALIAAARELHVEVIEFQHGIIYRHHPGYSWAGSASTHKPFMPLPNRFFLYGDYWQKELQIDGFWDVELENVGSLRMDAFRTAESATEESAARPLRLALTSQGIESENVARFLADLLNLAQTRGVQIRLDVKLHPGEQDDTPYRKHLTHAGVRILRGAQPPSTFELLQAADFHLSIASTCHYEALGLRTPTVILTFPNHEKVLHLTQTGFAFTASTPADALDLLLSKRGLRVPPEIGDQFFRANARENMLRALGEMA
ncbi:MAG: hypothetical protein OHK0052_21340 [Anaerolineales bacterium]